MPRIKIPPSLDPELRSEAKDIICRIIAADGGRFIGKVRLYKAFYHAHLYFWEHSIGALSIYPIVHMPQGPGIDRGTELIEELWEEDQINVIRWATPEGKTEFEYQLLQAIELVPTNDKDAAIIAGVQAVRDKTASEVSRETHIYSRSWRQAQKSGRRGDELNIYMDLVSDTRLQEITSRLEEVHGLVDRAFAQ